MFIFSGRTIIILPTTIRILGCKSRILHGSASVHPSFNISCSTQFGNSSKASTSHSRWMQYNVSKTLDYIKYFRNFLSHLYQQYLFSKCIRCLKSSIFSVTIFESSLVLIEPSRQLVTALQQQSDNQAPELRSLCCFWENIQYLQHQR